MTRTDNERVGNIIDMCTKLATIANGGRSKYDDDWMVQDAANYNLTILGEALDDLLDAALRQISALPAQEAKSLRNILVHKYWRTDPDILWRTITEDVPDLLNTILERGSSDIKHQIVGENSSLSVSTIAQDTQSTFTRHLCGTHIRNNKWCRHPQPTINHRCAAGHLRKH